MKNIAKKAAESVITRQEERQGRHQLDRFALDLSAPYAQERGDLQEQMIYDLSVRLTSRLEKRGYLPDSEEEIVAYGLFRCYQS